MNVSLPKTPATDFFKEKLCTKSLKSWIISFQGAESVFGYEAKREPTVHLTEGFGPWSEVPKSYPPSHMCPPHTQVSTQGLYGKNRREAGELFRISDWCGKETVELASLCSTCWALKCDRLRQKSIRAKLRPVSRNKPTKMVRSKKRYPSFFNNSRCERVIRVCASFSFFCFCEFHKLIHFYYRHACKKIMHNLKKSCLSREYSFHDVSVVITWHFSTARKLFTVVRGVECSRDDDEEQNSV